MSRVKSTRPRRLDRDAWIEAAFRVLNEKGAALVRIEPLAKKLRVTKGSFYWHFKDRHDLLEQLLDYWAREMTETVLRFAKEFHGDPMQRIFRTVHEIIGRERAKYDLAVRAWAKHDPQPRRVVEHIDNLRLSFLRGLFQDAGFGTEESEIRSRLLYYYVMGEHFTTLAEPMPKRLKKLQRKLEILTAGQ
ncbi:MAG: TetR/AcrR family transcriptional regulator [Gammaproteobacteria bacterium]|nr:TetR/AcrR family transcriptional regulator [Gammaproteobacteria bacterium]